MKQRPIPRTHEEIHPDWLSRAFADRVPGVRIETVKLLEEHELTNAHARFAVEVAKGSPSAPPSFFAKLPPSEEQRRHAIALTGMGLREARFYERLAPQLRMRTPEIYWLGYDEVNGDFLILMEDLPETGCTFSDGTWGLERDAAAGALEDLADLHLRFADPKRRKQDAGWVEEPDAHGLSDYGVTRLQVGLDQHRERLSDAFATVAQLYIERQGAMHALWHEAPLTVLHGDTHIGNLFLDDRDGGRVGFLDWGLITLSTPLREVSYFLIMALDPEVRRGAERELLRHYLERWNAGADHPIDFDRAWQTYRRQAAYAVPASCQIVTFPEFVSPARKRFERAFLGRAEAALADLEVVDALREAGIA